MLNGKGATEAVLSSSAQFTDKINFIDGGREAIVYVRSDGTRGTQWPSRLTSLGCRLDPRRVDQLISKEFKPTVGVLSEIRITLEKGLFGLSTVSNEKILQFSSPNEYLNVEQICLLQEALFSVPDEYLKENGLWNLVALGQPTLETALVLASRRPRDVNWKGPYSPGPQFCWPELNSGYDFGYALVAKPSW